MRIRVLGAGFYGCHIARDLIAAGHDVEIHEIRDRIFAGASGSIPARLHKGFHYPRSRKTREACLKHEAEFLEEYGHLTRAVPVNIYAIAADHSQVDFQQYVRTLRDEVEFIEIPFPTEYGVYNVEGAVLTGERHIVTDDARDWFEDHLGDRVKLGFAPNNIDDPLWDLTVDCTFCANDAAGVDRYEPCVVLLMKGPADRAITIMDGPFGSLYPWNPDAKISSLSSARWTPFSKSCKTYAEAKAVLDGMSIADVEAQGREMMHSMLPFYPGLLDLYQVVDHRLSIRAMPLSGADTRLFDVVRVGGRSIRVRAGKIDAIFEAARTVRRFVAEHARSR